MPAVERRNTTHGFMVTGETTSYGSGTPAMTAATDGVLLNAPCVLKEGWEYDGALEGVQPPAGRGRPVHRVPAGNFLSGAYSASVWSSAHYLLQALGFSATFDVNKWRYAPESSGYQSLVGESYFYQQKAAFKGGYCESLTIDFSSKAPPVWTFGLKGIATSQPAFVDASVPAITYDVGGILPTASGMTITATNAATSTILRATKGQLRITNELSNIGDLYSGATHPGFDPAGLTIEMDVTLEATTRDTSSPYLDATGRRFNPDAIFALGDAVQLVASYGASAGGRVRWGSTAQVWNLTAPVDPQPDGARVLWDATFACGGADTAGYDFYLDTD
jgi:hypothetical protein